MCVRSSVRIRDPVSAQPLRPKTSNRLLPWEKRCYGETQNRTGDTTIFSRVLYQLSYLAVGGRC